MSLAAPAAVRSALRKGLALVREGYAGKGLRGKTVEWAERLANGEPIDYAKAKKMRGWFARHGVAKAESAKRLRDPKSPAAVAYLLWGGTPSIPFRKAGWQDPVAPWLRDVLAKFESPRAGRRSERNPPDIEIVDTRQYDYEGGKWRPVPGSGDPRPCSCCGRAVVVHVLVRGVLYGDTCAKRQFASVTAKTIARAKDEAVESAMADRLRAVVVGRRFMPDSRDGMAQRHAGETIVGLRRGAGAYSWELVLSDGWRYGGSLYALSNEYGVSLS